jgi:hypothetical protein
LLLGVLAVVSVSLSLLGCATLMVTQHTKRLLQPVRYERAVRDGERLVIVYQIGVLHLEAAPDVIAATWGALDLGRVRWTPLDRIADIPVPLIQAPLPANFLSAEDGPPPALPGSGPSGDVPLVEMPPAQQTTRADEREYVRTTARERGLSLITVTRLGWPARLFLLMPEADPAVPRVARIEAPVRPYLGPGGVATRLALYPVTVAVDIATAPVQAFFFLVAGPPRR